MNTMDDPCFQNLPVEVRKIEFILDFATMQYIENTKTFPYFSECRRGCQQQRPPTFRFWFFAFSTILDVLTVFK